MSTMTKSVDSPQQSSKSIRSSDHHARVGTPRFSDGAGAAWMLAKREWIRFFRQRNRVTAAIAQPLLFWLLFGTGLKGSFTGAGELDFMQFFLPGTVALIVLFTAIFSTISVI
ncbi:MAG: ABC transporter, partial [Planctomycetes bacterium]|nr:ABC transporter [Planctomycetota bacterium]